MKTGRIHGSLLFCLAIVACATSDASAKTVYVDGNLAADCPDGNYSIAKRDGSGADGAAYATVQKAVDAVAAGDSIIVRGGVYHPSERTNFTHAGTASAYIELRSFPGETPVIDGRDIPAGNDSGTTPTWRFQHAKYWKITGPIILTNGRGAGVILDGDCDMLEFRRIESCYNGQASKQGGHGFFVWDGDDVLFENCDAHHNANHDWNRRAEGGEMCNRYQHGDGWRIWGSWDKNNRNIRLVGCRAWHNLDDNYDLMGANSPVELIDCWAAYAGKDDANGSITGTPNFVVPGDGPCNKLLPSPVWWGNGFKVGYAEESRTNSTARNKLVRCVAWGNLLNGFHMNKGPSVVYNSTSFNNGGSGFHFYTNGVAHVLRNNCEFQNGQPMMFYDPIKKVDANATLTDSANNSWDASMALAVTAADFANTADDAVMLGPRKADGSLPDSDFLHPAAGSKLIDKGADVGQKYGGSAPDIGAFESGNSATRPAAAPAASPTSAPATAPR